MKLIDILSEKKDEGKKKHWSADVKTKKHSPKDLFADGSAAEIVEWLKKEHSDLKGAMSALNFYINRAGTKLSGDRRMTLEKAKKMLHKEAGSEE